MCSNMYYEQNIDMINAMSPSVTISIHYINTTWTVVFIDLYLFLLLLIIQDHVGGSSGSFPVVCMQENKIRYTICLDFVSTMG